MSTNTSSTTQLSEKKRGGHNAVTAGNKIYFAGGETRPTNNWTVSNKIDVYDNATDTWSTTSLVEGKLAHTGIAVDDKIYWGHPLP